MAVEYVNTISGMITGLFYVFLLVIAVAIIVGFLFLSKFKYKIRIREIINGRKIVYDDKAREVDEGGVKYWKLFKLKQKIPVPPPDAIEVMYNGKKCVEAYRTDSEEIYYIKDDALEGMYEKDANGNMIISKTFKPLTTNSKQILIDGIRKANDRRSKKWQDHIMPITALGSLVIIAVSLMVFYGDMAKPLLEMGDKQASITAQQKETVQILQEIIQNKQVIKDSSGAKSLAPN